MGAWLFPLLQVGEAAEFAKTAGNWPLATFAIFVWLMTCLVAWRVIAWVVKNKDAIIRELAAKRTACEDGRLEDSQAVVAGVRADATRLEAAVQTNTAAQHATQEELRGLRSDVQALTSQIAALVASLGRGGP